MFLNICKSNNPLQTLWIGKIIFIFYMFLLLMNCIHYQTIQSAEGVSEVGLFVWDFELNWLPARYIYLKHKRHHLIAETHNESSVNSLFSSVICRAIGKNRNNFRNYINPLILSSWSLIHLRFVLHQGQVSMTKIIPQRTRNNFNIQ